MVLKIYRQVKSPKRAINLAGVGVLCKRMSVLAKQRLYCDHFPDVVFLLLILLLWRHVPTDKERRGERSTRDLADIQTHQTDEEDRPLSCSQAPEEVPPSHSPVRNTASYTTHYTTILS